MKSESDHKTLSVISGNVEPMQLPQRMCRAEILRRMELKKQLIQITLEEIVALAAELNA